MSLHYVLDGYNIINLIPDLTTLSLEDRRERLCRLIESQRPQGSLKNKVTIVYDGRSGFSSSSQSSSVKTIFSSRESADETIKKLVADAEHKKNIVVVTNDREIQYFVRALGAQVIDATEFLRKTTALPKTAKKTIAAKWNLVYEKKHISKTLEEKITSEFTDIWLRKRTKR